MNTMHPRTATQQPAPAAAAAHPTLAALLDDALQRHADLPACVCMGQTLSFAQIDRHSRHLALHLLGLGLARGDRVAVMLPNLPQLVVSVAAVLRAGLALVTLDPRMDAPELLHRLHDSAARVVVVLDAATPALVAVMDQLALQQVIVTTPGDLLGPIRRHLVNRRARRARPGAQQAGVSGALDFPAALDSGRQRASAAGEGLSAQPVGANDIALLQYSAGATGASKAAVLLHHNLMAQLDQAASWLQPMLSEAPPEAPRTTVAALPLQPLFGLVLVLLRGLAHGHCTVLVPDTDDIDALMHLLERQPFDGLAASGSLLQRVAEHADAARVDWRPLRLTLAGAAAVDPAVALLWLLRTGKRVCQAYGVAEAGPLVTVRPLDSPAVGGLIGAPLPGTDVLLLNDEGCPVPPGTPGEIAVRGPQVMAGYWQRPEDTARATTVCRHLRTGDIAVAEDNGELRLLGRRKDLIFVSGFDVYPGEIESVVEQMPGVRACAAVGVPDVLAGEVVKLVLVKADPSSTSPSEAEVRAWCELRLSGHKRPRVVEFRPELPCTAVGRVRRSELRELM
jgi:long-chain acyl-CoA synthetase